MTGSAHTQPTRLILVRHAEPARGYAGRCYGALDIPLSREGRRHAGRLADALAAQPASAVYTSPSRRACDTAEPIAARLKLAPVELPELRELDFGLFEGLTYRQIERRWPDEFADWMTAPTRVRFPGGEAYPDLERRAGTAVRTMRDANPGATIIAVTHGGVARAVIADVLPIPSHAAFTIPQRYGAINVIQWHQGRPAALLIDGCS